jgi:guanylate kinase
MKCDNMVQYKLKPIIIAICGKSATGKDTLSRCLVSNLKHRGYAAQIIVSDTTRPPRENEVDGVDYNFLTNKQFYDKIDSCQYLEYSKFNG